MATVGQEIINPRTGQRMTFRQTASASGRALVQIDTTNPPGPAEPEHVHPEQESSAEVLRGTLHFSIRGTTHVVPAGGKIVIPANTPHYFWNQGDGAADAIQEFRPALRIEDFFVTYFGLARDGLLNDQGLPSPLRTAVLTDMFWREIRVTSPPEAVQRLFATLLGPVGRWRGYGAEANEG